ncbi:hypothetical protein CPS_2630 [Colwellia psychrerythraea 34H]|uniref:Uncharacterized protein n=1 Tax=Colwellia psychrerythraea (strain 34H / ATCC BAA-681) TaxID=167879 RepID=Q481C5_COLP3|nr:hypothetical protein CPS_2630 [Colwellia psychrerythraea 34H]
MNTINSAQVKSLTAGRLSPFSGLNSIVIVAYLINYDEI